jgi:hypothetical protein
VSRGTPYNPTLLSFDYAASPNHGEGNVVIPATEVTLRDLFAAFALAGHLAGPLEAQGPSESRSDPARAAELAYAWADAMLKAR